MATKQSEWQNELMDEWIDLPAGGLNEEILDDWKVSC